MVKKVIITLTNGQVINAFQKNVSEGQKFLIVKDGVISTDDLPDLNMTTTHVPYHRIEYIEEHLVDEPEPGAKPQPEKPKIKMWRMAKEEIIQEG